VDPARLLRRRARAQAGLLALVCLLAGLVTATLVGTSGYVGIAARDGLTASLRSADPAAAAVRVHTRLSDDPAAQEDAAREVVADHLGALPVAVRTTARSLSVQAAAADGRPLGSVVAGADERLADRAEVVDGAWPPGAGGGVPAALNVDAASALGVAVGDELVLTGDSRSTPLTVQVAALWRPADPADPAWFGDAVDLDGTDGSVAGPLVLREADLAAVPALALVRWTLVPDPDALRPEQLPALRAALAALGPALQEDDAVNRQGVQVAGDLDRTLADVDRALTAVRGVSTSAALLAVLVGLVVLGQLARLLVEVRGPETVLLRSRGVTVGRSAAWAAAESAVVVGAGAAAGAAGAVLALRPLGAVPPAVVAGGAVGVVAVGVAMLTGTAAARSSRALRAARPDAGRLRTGAAGGAVVVAVAVTALAAWRLADLGSPVVVGADGRSSVDPLAAAAVPFALVLVALLAAVALAPLARLGARWTARRPGLGPVLTARQVVRRPTAHAASAALVALTVAISVFVPAYVGTSRAQREAAAVASTGADLRVDLGDRRAVADASDPADRAVAAGVAAVAAAPGVTKVAPARADAVALGGVDAELVALPAAELGAVALPPAGVAAGDLAAVAVADGLPGVPLPAGASRLTAAADVTTAGGVALDAEVAAWLAAGPGTLTRVVLTGGSAALPGGGAWRLVALDVRTADARPYRVTVTTLAADGTDLLAGAAWSARLLGEDAVDLTPAGTVVEVGTAALTGRRGAPVRLLPGEADARVPVVLSAALADELGLEAGDATTARYAARDVPVVVAGTVAAVPGGGSARALLADLDALDGALLRQGPDVPRVAVVWAAAPDRAAAAVAVRAALADRDRPAVVRAADPVPAPLSRPALVVFWLAAGSALVLAVGGAAAAARALGRERDGEIGVLRALGVSAAAQGRARVAELAASTAVAALVGLAGGAAVAVLGARTLVRATTGTLDGAAVTGPLAVQALGAVVLLALTAVATAAVAVDAGLRVRARAASAPVRQEAQQ
jgi:ABC-type lipoprotein release transport system permease subunit